MDQPIWLTFLVAFIFMNVLLVGMAYMTWYERKVLAAMQDRVGPNRTGPKGLLQPIADGIKLLGKEDLIPAHADKVVFYFAPLIVFVVAITRVAVIPFGNTITVFGHPVNLWVTDLNVGALFLLAFGSLGVYGIILGGYASATAIRSSAVSALRPRSSPTRSCSACRSWASSSSRRRSASAPSWSSRRETWFSRSARSP